MAAEVRVDKFDQQPDPPYATSRLLPFVNHGAQQWLPVLFIEEPSGKVALSYEALAWARASLAAFSLSTIEHNIQVLARFVNFYRVWCQGKPLEDGDLDYLVYAYLIHRYAGTLDEKRLCLLGGLNWRPISYKSLRPEFRILVRYLRFCAMTWGHVNLCRQRFRANESEAPFKRMAAHEMRKEADLLAHLAAARDYWRNRYGGDLKMPPVAKPPPKPRTIRNFPTTEEVWSVVDAEKNPVYKCLWLAAAFGGLRISEQLNAWQIDIRPASDREFFFGERSMGHNGTILFLRTDPVESKYVDDTPGVKGVTRRQHLIEKYGLSPRNLLPRQHPQYAGWKGTVYSGELLTHQVFWIDDRAAAIYAHCATQIRRFHQMNRTSRFHPWWYVNIADPTGRHRGNPVTISRVEKALDNAYRRVGLEPHQWGRNLHGFRHYYKATAEDELGIPPEHLQVMLGHSSIISQSDYGRSAQTTGNILKSAIESRQQRVGNK